MKRMDVECMVKKVINSDVEGSRERERPQFGWMDGVRRVLRGRGMSLEQSRRTALDRRYFRHLEGPWTRWWRKTWLTLSRTRYLLLQQIISSRETWGR